MVSSSFLSQVTPPSGPVEGDTTITIVGTNLGLAATDISLVTIGSSALCNVIDYVVGRRYMFLLLYIYV